MVEQAHRLFVDEVTLTEARNLSPWFERAVSDERPVRIVRSGRDHALLVSASLVHRLLASYQFTILAETDPDYAFSFNIIELDIRATGPTKERARINLIALVQDYVREYIEQFGFYRRIPEFAVQEPYVRRLSLARDDTELTAMLFEGDPAYD